MKIGICVPLYNVVPASFFVNFINRLHELYDQNKYNVQIYMRASTIVDKARNDLVKMALNDNCDYVFFIDSDTLIPKGAIDSLLNMNVDIASGLYFTKQKPYLPVARVKEGEMHFFLEDFEFNQIMEVQGVGMGCCLIKMDVFRKMEYPYFKLEWRKHDGIEYQIAEDLYFCDEAIKAGYKIHLNTGVVCEHFGIEVGPEQFMIYKQMLKEDRDEREEMIQDLMEFEKLSREEVLSNFLHRYELRANEMKKYDLDDPVQNLRYYTDNQWEIYDHLEWHFKGRRSFDRKLLEEIKRDFPERSTEILDFGSGAGQMAYMLAREKYMVSACDPSKKANDFMSFRFQKHRLKIKRLPMPIHPEFKNQYDVILCFDVLEHIPDDKFDETIELLKRLKKPEGKIYATVSFGASEMHPGHFNGSEEKNRKIMELLK
jgi:2-polyprenyl-3-methyl-5-hydroxy-6-metoxy-1,4-benzoquinol methylase